MCVAMLLLQQAQNNHPKRSQTCSLCKASGHDKRNCLLNRNIASDNEPRTICPRIKRPRNSANHNETNNDAGEEYDGNSDDGSDLEIENLILAEEDSIDDESTENADHEPLH